MKRKIKPEPSGGRPSKVAKAAESKALKSSESISLRRAATITVDQGSPTPQELSKESKVVSKTYSGTANKVSAETETKSNIGECANQERESGSGDGLMFKIPSGLTQLVLPSTSTMNSFSLPQFDLIDTIDESEMDSALASLTSFATTTKLSADPGADTDDFKTSQTIELFPEVPRKLSSKGLKTSPETFPFEVALVVCGDKKEMRDKTKDFAKIFLELIPGTRLAVVVGGDVYGEPNSVNNVAFADFGASLTEIYKMIDTDELSTDGVEIKNKDIVCKAREILSWTPGCPGQVFPVGDHFLGVKTEVTVQHTKEFLVRGMIRPEKPIVGESSSNISVLKTVKTNKNAKRVPTVPLLEASSSDISVENTVKTNKEAKSVRTPATEPAVRKSARLRNSLNKKLGRIHAAWVQWKKTESVLTAKTKTTPASRRRATKARKLKGVSAEQSTKQSNRKRDTKSEKSIAKVRGSVKKSTLRGNSEVIKPTMKEKKFREHMSDTILNIGPLKKLKWSRWTAAICNDIPRSYYSSEFTQSHISKSFYRKGLEDRPNFLPAIFEFGVKLSSGSKKWVMCYRVCGQSTARNGLLMSTILHDKRICKELQSLLHENCEVHARWGIPKGKDKETKLSNFEGALSHMETIDYAWAKHGKTGHRKVVEKGIVLSGN